VCGMIISHMDGGTKMSPKSTRKLLVKLTKLGLTHKDWIYLRIADRAANKAKEPYTNKTINRLYSKFDRELNPEKSENRVVLSHKDLAISGTRIQELLNIGPSQLIGVILNYLMDRTINDSSLNTPEELTKLILGKKPRPKK
jgi:tRNA nucleotidyltransferase (CCA-adding enzyme)